MSVASQIQKGFDRVENKLIKQYRDLLKNHDWYSEYSDDHSVWERASVEYSQILQLAKSIDFHYKIFNTYAPDEFKLERNDDGSN